MDRGGFASECIEFSYRALDNSFECHLGIGLRIFGPDEVSAHRMGDDAGGAAAEEWVEDGIAWVR